MISASAATNSSVKVARKLSRARQQAAVWTLLALFAPAPAFALDPASLKPQGYVSDFANVIAPQYKAALEQYCHAVETATGAQLAVVTVDTLDDAPIEDFTNTLYRQWGVGKKGKNEGAMLLLAVRDRKSRIEVGYGLEPVITDGLTGSTLRQMRPQLSAGQYGPALLAAIETLGSKAAEAHGTTIDTTGMEEAAQPRRVRPQGGSGGIPVGAIIFLIVVVLLLSRGGRGGGGGFLAGMILGNVLGRGGSGYGGGFGGGGFGGGGGGGGFGGFGGGDSGGGGASSNW